MRRQVRQNKPPHRDRAAARLVLTSALRAYQAGARAATRAALVRRFHEDHRRERKRIERERRQLQRLHEQRAQTEALRALRKSEPALFLTQAFEAIAAMWQPATGR